MPLLKAKKILTTTFLVLVGLASSAQIVANFQPTSVSGCAPKTIKFNNTTTGAPIATSYWNFGNGQSSSFSSPSIIYTNPGNYNVSLVVTDPNGNSSSYSQTIRIFANPSIQFNLAQTTLCSRDIANYINTTKEGDTTITQWLWDFGDGYSSSMKEPKHQYLATGKFTVSLYAKDVYGCESDTTVFEYVKVNPRPESKFSFSETRHCKAPVNVSFNNLTAQSTANFYRWEFGDGSVTTGSYNTSHSYSSNGRFDVTLIAGNSFGCYDTSTVYDEIEINPLVADFTWPNTDGCSGNVVNLTQNVKPQLTTATGYNWFLPGNKWIIGKEAQLDAGPGTHKVILEVNNKDCKDTITKYVTIRALPPNTIKFNRKNSCNFKTWTEFEFDPANIDSFMWRIDDKQNVAQVKSSTLFQDEGAHTFSLFLRDSFGCETTYHDTIYSSNLKVFLGIDTGGCVPYDFSQSYLYNGKYGLAEYEWTYDGQITDTFYGEQPPRFYYADTGAYYINLKVTDSIGCESESVRLVGAGMKPEVEVIIHDDTLCNNAPFQVESISVGEIKPNEFFWLIGSFTSKEQNPTLYLRLTPEEHSLVHHAKHFGCADTVLKEDSIYILAPFVRFTMINDSCFLERKQVLGEVYDADTMHYELNDSFFRSDTSYTYVFEPNDKLKMFATNYSNGCVDSVQREIISGNTPYINWDVLAKGCVPMDIFLERKALNVDSIVWYFEGTRLNFDQKEINYTMYAGGTVNFGLKGYGGKCVLELDTTFTALGPKVGLSTLQSVGCLPITYQLNDSFWNQPNTVRYWVIDGDTVPSTQFQTKYTLTGVKDPSDNIVSIKLVAEQDSCKAFRQVNYRFPGVRFTTTFRDSIVSCNESDYFFTIDVHPDDSLDIDNFNFRYGSINKYSYDNHFKQRLKTDGTTDTIYINIKDKLGCITSQKLIIEKPLPALQADLNSTTRKATCPPLLVNFKDLSYSKLGPIAERRWYVNNDFFSNAINPSRLFTLPGNYTISLSVSDTRGCKDSIALDSFVNIQGDPVDINYNDFSLCRYDSAHFDIVSGNADAYEWDMGDGTVIAGEGVSYHYQEPGVYRVIVLVSDTSGCKYPLYAEDSIRVFEVPKASLIPRNQCLGQDIKLVSSSTAKHIIDEVNWKVQSKNYPKLDSILHPTSNAKNILAYIQVTDTNGCRDSTSEQLKLYDLKADFELNKTAFCVGDSVELINTSTSDTGIIVSRWFNHLNQEIDPSNTSKYLNNFEGYLGLKLLIVNQASCRDSITKTDILKVSGATTLSNTKFKSVSVNSDNTVQVELSADTTAFFNDYSVFGPGGVYKFADRTDTSVTLLGIDASLSSLCFRAGASNICAELDSNVLDIHCTMLTTGYSDTMKRCLDWNAYSGWNKVGKYYIYRQKGSSFELIDSVDGNTHNYCDDQHPHCDDPETYKILAINAGLKSFSDTAVVRPIWIYSLDPGTIKNVSVLSDGEMEIVLDSSQNNTLPFAGFQIDRMDRFGTANTQKYTDVGLQTDKLSLNTQESYYTYILRQLDACNSLSDSSAPARSILLDIEIDKLSGYPKLSWNKAEVWTDGISHYVLERNSGASGFEEIAIINNINDTSYLDKLVDVECATKSCYRVAALSLDQAWTSYSNERCASAFSTLFVPNAFTLNGDAVNETFQPRGVYISTYKISIYDRWGEMLFESNQCMDGWDGTFQGEPVQQGMYFYTIEARGIDDVPHILKGTIMVFR